LPTQRQPRASRRLSQTLPLGPQDLRDRKGRRDPWVSKGRRDPWLSKGRRVPKVNQVRPALRVLQEEETCIGARLRS
jgi:hypothetical protein